MEKVKYLDPQLIKMFLKKCTILIVFIFSLTLSSLLSAENKVEHKIAVLVNEEIITSYDIVQRLKLGKILQNININDNNNQLVVNLIIDELIHEKLKLEKINEYKIEAKDEEYQKFESNFFKQNNLNKSKIELLLIENNVSYIELKKRLENELLWGKLISALYYRLTSVSELEVNEIKKNNPLISIEQAENLVIQRQLDLKSSKLLRDMMNEATIEFR